MPDSFATVDVPLTPALALQINDVCDRFEVAWKATARDAQGPRIEEHLAGASGQGRAVLLRHLVLLDIDYRRLRGERPTASEYGARFSSLSGRDLAQAASPRRRPRGFPPRPPGSRPHRSPSSWGRPPCFLRRSSRSCTLQRATSFGGSTPAAALARFGSPRTWKSAGRWR